MSAATTKDRPMRHLKRAAEAGDANAQFNLGMMFDSRLDDNNRPAPSNRAEAIHWLLQSARQGLPRAQTRLAELYADEPESADRRVEAGAWFIRALANASGAHRERAQLGFAQLAATLTADQAEAAEAMARQFEPDERPVYETPSRRHAR